MKKIMQVKRYNDTVASPQYYEALSKWSNKENGYGYPSRGMFVFFTDNEMNYERCKGWVVYDDIGAKLYQNKNEALKNIRR